jgi:hypothetical protein
MFAISDRFTVSRVAATAAVIAAVMALGFGLRAADAILARVYVLPWS